MDYELIGNLRRKQEYYLHEAPHWVRRVWPRQESFDWFLKNYRSTLVALNAIVRLGRDYFINAETFADEAQKILGLNPRAQETEL